MLRGLSRTPLRNFKGPSTGSTFTLIRSHSLQQHLKQPQTRSLHVSWLVGSGLALALGGLTLASLQEKVYALEATQNGDQICQAIVQNDFRTLRKLAEDPNFTPNFIIVAVGLLCKWL
ncbi:unnamed protein product [Absidia cylindrospora]